MSGHDDKMYFLNIHCIIYRDNIARQGYNATIIPVNPDIFLHTTRL
jgi:hypothetical protein